MTAAQYTTVNAFGIPDPASPTIVPGPVPDIPHPAYKTGTWASDPAAYAATARAAEESLKPAALAQVDADVDAIYAAVVGNRGLEYEAAEREAAAYAAAGYNGTAGPMVQSWADVKGWPADEAADDILQQATAWRAAMAAIRAQRLATKEALRSATTAAAVQTAAAQWAAFVDATSAALGIV